MLVFERCRGCCTDASLVVLSTPSPVSRNPASKIVRGGFVILSPSVIRLIDHLDHLDHLGPPSSVFAAIKMRCCAKEPRNTNISRGLHIKHASKSRDLYSSRSGENTIQISQTINMRPKVVFCTTLAPANTLYRSSKSYKHAS